MDKSGFLIIDKPSGITSSGLVQQLKKMFGIKKIGHTGTLDPLATGLMILCLGQATKFSRFLIDQSKSYTVAIKLGIATDTYDSEGKVTSRGRTEHLSRELIEQALKKFRGNIQQVPPVYSAKKKMGFLPIKWHGWEYKLSWTRVKSVSMRIPY